VTLTNEGKQFYQEVAPLLAGLEAAAIDAGQSATTVCSRLRVNVDPIFSRSILAPHLCRFLKTHPELSLEIAVRDRLGDPVVDQRGPARCPEATRFSVRCLGFGLTSSLHNGYAMAPFRCFLSDGRGSINVRIASR
jgi:hypothetical protein